MKRCDWTKSFVFVIKLNIARIWNSLFSTIWHFSLTFDFFDFWLWLFNHLTFQPFDIWQPSVAYFIFSWFINFEMFQLSCWKLYNWLKVAPYQVDQPMEEEDENFDTSRGMRIMGVAYAAARYLNVDLTRIILHEMILIKSWESSFGENKSLYNPGLIRVVLPPQRRGVILRRHRRGTEKSWTSFVCHIWPNERTVGTRKNENRR